MLSGEDVSYSCYEKQLHVFDSIEEYQMPIENMTKNK